MTRRDTIESNMRRSSEDKENNRAVEHDHAVLRALTENAYVKKVNEQLIAKLNTMTSDSDISTDETDFKSSRRADEKVITLAKLEELESKQRSMDDMVTALRESLDAACRERDDANAKVAALLLAADEPVDLVNDVWERKDTENWKHKYNESSKKLIEVMYERDRLKIKCDEMQGMKGVETVFVSKKKDDWEIKYEELAIQLNQVTSERDCLRNEISKKVEELLAEKEDSENLASEKASMENVIAELTKKVDGNSETRSSMQLMIDSLQYKVAAIKLAKDFEVGNLRQELESANASLVKTTSQKDYLSIEYSSLKQKILALEVDIAEVKAAREHDVRGLQDELAAARALLINADGNAKNHSVELEALNTQLKVANESLNAMRVENRKISEELRTHQSTSIESLSDFKRRLDSAEANNDSLASARDDLQIENTTLQNQLQNLQSYLSEITASQHRMDTTEHSIEIVSSNHMQQAENDFLSKERDELISKNAALKQKNETLQKKLSEVTAAGDTASEAFSKLIGGLRVQLAEKEKLSENSSHQLNDYMEEVRQEHDQLKSKIGVLESELLQSRQEEERLRSGADSANVEQMQLKSKIDVLESSLRQSLENEEKLRSALDLLEAKFAEAHAQLKQEHADLEAHRMSSSLTLDAIVEKATLEQEQLKSTIGTINDELCRAKQEEEKLRCAMASMEQSQAEELTCLENDKAVLEGQVKSMTLMIDDLKERANLEQEQLKSKVETLEDDLRKAMLSNISDAKRERDQAISKVEGLSDELKSTAIVLSQVHEFISKDKEQAAETQKQLRTLEAEKKQLELSLVSIGIERDELIQRLEFSRQETEDFRSKWESSKSAIESITNRCELVESEIEASKQVVTALNDKLESSESLIKAMDDQCEQLRSTISDLTAKCEEADALVTALQLENHCNIASSRQQEERSNTEIASLENEIKSLKLGHEAFKVEAEATAAAQLKSCEAKLESLCEMDENYTSPSQDRTFDDLISILRKDRSKLAEKLASTSILLEAAQTEISALELAVASVRQEYETFKVEADAAATAQMKSFQETIEPLQDELSNKVDELEVAQNEKVVLEEEVCSLSTELSKFKMQNKGLLKAMDQLTKYM